MIQLVSNTYINMIKNKVNWKLKQIILFTTKKM